MRGARTRIPVPFPFPMLAVVALLLPTAASAQYSPGAAHEPIGIQGFQFDTKVPFIPADKPLRATPVMYCDSEEPSSPCTTIRVIACVRCGCQ